MSDKLLYSDGNGLIFEAKIIKVSRINTMAKYLTKVDFTQKPVATVSLMGPGGVSSPGVYTRSRRNMLTSPTLLRRIAGVAAAMKEACSLGDHCTNNPKLVGKTAPDGKPFKACTRAEADSRKQAAVECAKRVLPTTY